MTQQTIRTSWRVSRRVRQRANNASSRGGFRRTGEAPSSALARLPVLFTSNIASEQPLRMDDGGLSAEAQECRNGKLPHHGQ